MLREPTHAIDLRNENEHQEMIVHIAVELQMFSDSSVNIIIAHTCVGGFMYCPICYVSQCDALLLECIEQHRRSQNTNLLEEFCAFFVYLMRWMCL
jgi:hypothetical protein